jgi:hypothetical protein
VQQIELYYGFTTEYICAQTSYWRKRRLSFLLKEQSSDKIWNIEQINLGREPGDKSDAMKLNSRITQLVDLFRSGVNQYHDGKQVKLEEDIEDGTMKVIN